MTRPRLLVALAGAGVLLASLPALAQVQGVPEARAAALLQSAAHAATSRSWSGTQYVGTWRGDAQTSAVVEVVHRPGSGSRVRTADGGQGVVTPELDARLLSLLVDHYDLVVARDARCVGRTAHVVEARRPGHGGAGAVAGRFWLDAASGLVLRREVYDDAGRRLHSSAFVDLQVDEPAAAPLPTPAPRVVPAVSTLDWQPPRELPDGLQLFDVQVRDHDGGEVLHLAYSDGLSTLSVFAQSGGMPERPRGFRAERVHGTRAWVQASSPERVVWQGDGRVFTLVSDAAPDTVRAAVQALPRDPAPRSGVLGRLGRGLSRLGSLLNPFD